MWLRFFIIFVLIFTRTRLLISAEDFNFNFCMKNKTISVNIHPDENDDKSCHCQTKATNDFYTRDDYVFTSGVGAHKLHKDAKTWKEARNICRQEGGHLAIINSKAEEAALLNIFRRESKRIENGVNQDQALLGIHDLFNEGEWVTLFDEPIASTGYAAWSSDYWNGILVQQPDNKDNNQNCGALVLKGGLDDIHCHEAFGFFCELPLNCE